MKNTIPILTFALTVSAFALGVCRPATAQQALTEPQIQGRLADQGYTRVHDLKFKDGMWHAEAKSANDKRVDIRIDASTGKVYPDRQVSTLSKHDVEAALETQGYTHVRDVDYDNGIWTAKAKNASGNKVKLRIDAGTGKVIGVD